MKINQYGLYEVDTFCTESICLSRYQVPQKEEIEIFYCFRSKSNKSAGSEISALESKYVNPEESRYMFFFVYVYKYIMKLYEVRSKVNRNFSKK